MYTQENRHLSKFNYISYTKEDFLQDRDAKSQLNEIENHVKGKRKVHAVQQKRIFFLLFQYFIIFFLNLFIFW